MTPRTILYTGKGGVGKTSVAAATALAIARSGLRTIVMSTDPAHSLSDSLETGLGPQPMPVADNLWAQEVQAEAEMERHWQAVQRWLGGLLSDRGVDRILAEELTVPPGMDEIFSLLQLKRHHESGEFDVIIVDCAPTGETLRLLSFPEVARWWLEKVFPWEKRLLTAARPFAKTVLDLPLPGNDVLAEVQDLVRNLIDMSEILRDRSRSSIRLVMNPERMVIKEAQRTFTYLNLYGYLTDAVVVNRVFPADVEGGYFSAWREVQREHVELVEQAFAPVPVLRAPFFEQEVVGAGDAGAPRRGGVRLRGAGACSLPRAEPGPEDGRRQRGAAPARAVRREGRREAEEDRPRAGDPGGRAQAQHRAALGARLVQAA